MKLKDPKEVFYQIQASENKIKTLDEWIEKCKTIIKDVQKNAVEVALKVASNKVETHSGMDSDIDLKTILSCKEKLFKKIDDGD